MGTSNSVTGHTNDPACDADGGKRPGKIVVTVSDTGDMQRAVRGAGIVLYRHAGLAGKANEREKFKADSWTGTADDYRASALTNADGQAIFTVDPGTYVVVYRNVPKTDAQCVRVESGCITDVCFRIALHAQVVRKFLTDDCKELDCHGPRKGDLFQGTMDYENSNVLGDNVVFEPPLKSRLDAANPRAFRVPLTRSGNVTLSWKLRLAASDKEFPGAPVPADAATILGEEEFVVDERTPQPIEGNLGVALQRTATAETEDLAHWRGIINSTERLSFNQYLRFMDMLFCADPASLPDGDKFKVRFDSLRKKRFLPFNDTDAYRLLKVATEAFVMVNCGVLTEPDRFDDARDRNAFALRDLPFPSDGLGALFDKYLEPVVGGAADARTLPYLAEIRRKLADVDIKIPVFDELDDELVSVCHGILQEKLTAPCLMELIWSYWHEEGMLVQTINAITRRFQNVRSGAGIDPLANLEIDPLRPLNNLLWGYVQDEQHRLSVVRRNYEYDHHYGLRLDGRAVQDHKAADTRSKFLEAFHHLLHMANVFFKQDDDTTVKADAFPVLNALKEVHLILTEGQHNQFGDLPSTARVEMLMQQFLLARPEFREFLPTRISVAYPEAWMDRVDAMKKVQGWTDTSVLQFRNLGVFGEQILLGIRWGFWSDVQEPTQAFNWLRHFRPQIQGYIHAYRAATGVDLTSEAQDAKIDATLPSALLRKRLASQQRSA